MLINENKLIPLNEIKYNTEIHCTALNTLMQKITAQWQICISKSWHFVIFKIEFVTKCISKYFSILIFIL